MEPQTWNRILDHVRTLVQQEGLWHPGSRIVVAVSGGPDSIALLHVLHQLAPEYNWTVICAHMNHGFRPEESAEEAAFVREQAAALGIPFELEQVDAPAYMEQTGKGAQEAARELRYRFLHKVADCYNANSIALAHHMDDQAETVMMRIIRGTGPEGISGIKMRRTEKKVELVRPFLRIYKADLIRSCEECSFEYMIDSSNEHRKYTRNRIRLDVLPFLEQYNRQLVPTLARLAEIAGTESEYIQQQTEALYAELVKEKEGSFSFSVTSFAGAHVALQRRLIKLILNYLSSTAEQFDFAKIELIRQQIVQSHLTSWNLDVGDRLVCVREYENIRFMHDTGREIEAFCIPLQRENALISIPGSSDQVEIRLLEWKECHSEALQLSSDEALFDADLTDFPLYLRSRRPGDIIRLLGSGTKKVKNLFIDAKIPLSQRDCLPLLADDQGRILWIPGVRRSQEALLHPGSVHCLYMRRIKSAK
ncbi:tRNA lysidine(34) synthetase TilS [Paenibacillus sp. Z6-24]